MGLNLYIIKISSNLMENIICSYRGTFKATVLTLFKNSIMVDIEKNDVRMEHILLDKMFLISCMLTPPFLSLVQRCLSECRYAIRKALV